MMDPLKRTAVLTLSLLLAACAPAQRPASSTDGAESALPAPAASESSAAQPPSAEGADRLYRIYRGEQTIVMDGDGNLLPDEEAYTPLYDLLTGAEAYRLRTKNEDTGGDDEYGNPVVQQYCSLCDAKGTLLYDWEPVTYRAAFSGLLIRQDPRSWWSNPSELEGYSTALWNPATGETVADGVDSLQEMGDGSVLALDVTGRTLGVLDSSGKVLSGFPAPADYYYPNAKWGMISADAGYNPYGPYDPGGKPSSALLLDRDFNILFECEQLNLGFYGLRGPYALWHDHGRTGLLSLPSLTRLYSISEEEGDIQYFDGERLILRTGTRNDPLNPWRCFLYDLEGNLLAGPYEQLSPEDEWEDRDAPAGRFLAGNGGTLSLLDRDGGLITSAELPGLCSFSSLGDGYYTYNIERTGDSPDSFSTHLTGLLGPDFEVVLPAEQYQSIYRLTDWAGQRSARYDLLECGRELPNGVWRFDLLTLSGEPVLGNLSVIGDAGPGRIAVIRGSSMGLIDFSSRWIARRSIYQGLQND